MKRFTNYTKTIETTNKHFLNIAAYTEFDTFCIKQNLSIREAMILKYILMNSKEWEVSPTTIAKEIYGENYTEYNRKYISRNLTSLLKKIDKYISLPEGRSKGGNNGGTIIDASKVYDEIYNAITTNQWNTVNENKSVEDEIKPVEDEIKELLPEEEIKPAENKETISFEKMNTFINDEYVIKFPKEKILEQEKLSFKEKTNNDKLSKEDLNELLELI